MRSKQVPPGYAGHVPCRTEVFGMTEEKHSNCLVRHMSYFKLSGNRRNIKRKHQG